MTADRSTRAIWTGRVTQRGRPDAVRVFEHDPDLLAGIDAETAEKLRRAAVTRWLELPCGPWSPPAGDALRGGLGLLVLDGLVCRSICVHGRDCPELLGAGDLLRPWAAAGSGLIDEGGEWRVLQPTTLAILGERFTALLGRWPSIMVALVARSTQRSRALAIQLAIAHTRQAETRLLILFWQLADRWGRVSPEGVILSLPLSMSCSASSSACIGRRRPRRCSDSSTPAGSRAEPTAAGCCSAGRRRTAKTSPSSRRSPPEDGAARDAGRRDRGCPRADLARLRSGRAGTTSA